MLRQQVSSAVVPADSGRGAVCGRGHPHPAGISSAEMGIRAGDRVESARKKGASFRTQHYGQGRPGACAVADTFFRTDSVTAECSRCVAITIRAT
jgi:hypothetical protein